MIQDNNGITTINCDKCNVRSSASTIVSNEIFFSEGWALRPRAKKYTHLCRQCQSEKQRKYLDFVAATFRQ